MTTGKMEKKEFMSGFWRSCCLQGCFNYERQQGLGFGYAMIPHLRRIYKDDPEGFKEAMKRHLVFYNITPQCTTFVQGIAVAMEEEAASNPDFDASSINAIKTALMGPFAGVGDTIFSMIPGAVFGSIAATMAKEGSVVGIMIWEIWLIGVLLLRFKLYDIGYQQGAKIVNTLSGIKETVTAAASVLGLTVVGGMIATMVKFPLKTLTVSLGTDPKTGEMLLQEFPLQKYMDSIMPGLMPALFAVLCYWMLGQKWMNSNRLIITVLVLAIVLASLGIVEV